MLESFGMFFGAVAGAVAVAAPVVKNIGEIAQGARRALKLADVVLDIFRKNAPLAKQPAIIQQALTQAAVMPPEQFAKQAEAIVDQALPDKTPEYRKAVTEYLKLMPEQIKTAFARPDDPTGTTLPLGWVAREAEDIVPILPPRGPVFSAGQNPPHAPTWVLTERLGIGGFGEVWKAQSTQMKNTFRAFKFCLDPVAQQRIIENEMHIIELVRNELNDNPHIVKLLDAHLDGDTPWLQYEYVPGGDLAQHIRTWPQDIAARTAQAQAAIKTLAATLAECHQFAPKAVIHRDMKPANVLLGNKGILKITDFGISQTQARQKLESLQPTASAFTAPTMVRGAHTPMYASPQQKQGFDAHPADDVHALGVMFYQMILGDLTLDLGADLWDDLEEKHLCKPLLELLSRCVANRVARRYQDASELLAALEALPEKLVATPVVVTFEDLEADLDAQMNQRYVDAKTKNTDASRLCDQRQWAQAISVLESIRLPWMRNPDLVERATAFQNGKRFINSLNMEFVRVPNGTFWMGGSDGICGTQQVTIEEDFYIGVYPVTQEEWTKVTGSNPSHFQKGGKGADKLTGVPDADLKRFPVETVSYEDCQVFLRKLNEIAKETGWLYRLPREAEWEYAYRGGATSQADCAWSYYFKTPSNTLSPQQANYSDSGLGRTCKVGLYLPNPLGIYDCSGNVWEWCEDAYDGSKRVIRGGGWDGAAGHCRAAFRNGSAPTYRNDGIGFRLARVRVR